MRDPNDPSGFWWLLYIVLCTTGAIGFILFVQLMTKGINGDFGAGFAVGTMTTVFLLFIAGEFRRNPGASAPHSREADLPPRRLGRRPPADWPER